MCKKLTCDRSVICNLVLIAPVPNNSDSARTERWSDNSLMNTITWHQAGTRDQEIWLLLTQIPCPFCNIDSKGYKEVIPMSFSYNTWQEQELMLVAEEIFCFQQHKELIVCFWKFSFWYLSTLWSILCHYSHHHRIPHYIVHKMFYHLKVLKTHI